jgi:hypothetical protein
MAEVHLQRQGRDEEKCQGGEERQPVSRPDRDHIEDPFERRENERAGNQSRQERIQDDQHAPLQFDFVRVNESFDALHASRSYRTEPSSAL